MQKAEQHHSQQNDHDCRQELIEIKNHRVIITANIWQNLETQSDY